MKKYDSVRHRYYCCVVCLYSIRADRLEAAFFADVDNLVAEPALLKRWIAQPRLNKTELAAIKRELRQIEALNHPARIAKRRDQIFNLALAASISSEDFKLQMDREDSEFQARAAHCVELGSQLEAHLVSRRSIEHATSLLARCAAISMNPLRMRTSEFY